MLIPRAGFACLSLLLILRGCSGPRLPRGLTHAQPELKYKATGPAPEVLALYEAWFGLPNHIHVGYSSQDPDVIRRQIREAKARGISAFVVDWYGGREPFINRSYQIMQKIAAEENFHVAILYDETKQQNGATDATFSDLTMLHDNYLSEKAPGHQAYLTYHGRPVIFIFPTQGHTHWDRIRHLVDKWKSPPFLINEFLPKEYVDSFDGFYAWINPGPQGWAADGNHWGSGYLDNFYETMRSKYSDKIIVGGAWAGFDDSKASWSLNRHISARCGQTFQDTFNFWQKYFPSSEPIPFVLVETWNDYEEGSAVEPGLPTCNGVSKMRLSFKPR